MCIRDRRKIPVEDIANVKAVIKRLPSVQEDKIHYEAVRTLRRTGLPKNNMSMELRALWELKAENSTEILMADKGSATVVQQ